MGYVDTQVLMETLEILRDEWAPVNNGYIAINEVLEYVKEMPSVDAIPVEFIGDYVKSKASPFGVIVINDMMKEWLNSQYGLGDKKGITE